MRTTDWFIATTDNAPTSPLVWGGFMLALWYVLDQFAFTQREKAHRATPETPGSPPLIHDTLAIIRNTHRIREWATAIADKFKGRPYRSKMLGCPDMIVLTTPEHFEDVMKTQFEKFDKGPYLRSALQDLLGNGIFGVDGSHWVHQRKTASNLFTMRALRESMTAVVHDKVHVLHALLQEQSQKEEPIDVFKMWNKFTMDAFAKIGFGVELGSLTSSTDHPFQAAFDRVQSTLILRLMRPQWFWRLQRSLNVGAEAQLKRDIKTIDIMVLDIIGKSLQCRADHTDATKDQSTAHRDIVSLFLDGVAPGDEFDPVYLRDIVVNFLIAGRDTTAQALSWFFYCISQHPDVETKIRDEIVRELPHLMTGSTRAASMEESSRLVYLEAALKETLRLFPSVPSNVRCANCDVTLFDGTFIKAGSMVSVSSYLLGRMEHVWGPDAKQFRPERWIDPQTGKIISVSAFKFNSFHAGPRMCLGMNLAMMEMKVVVSSVLSQFHLGLVAGQEVTYDISLTLPIRGGLMMDVHPAA